MRFLLQSHRELAGRPERKYSQGREKRNLDGSEITGRFTPPLCIKIRISDYEQKVSISLPFSCPDT